MNTRRIGACANGRLKIRPQIEQDFWPHCNISAELEQLWRELSSGEALRLERAYPGHIRGRFECFPRYARAWDQVQAHISQARFECLSQPGETFMMADKPSSDSPKEIIQKLYLLLPGAVLLPIPLGEKGLKDPGWQNITFDETQTPDYQWRLYQAVERGGNIGVRLGPKSRGLYAIDIDDDEIGQWFLEANPDLRHTLRSRGARGYQLWLRLTRGSKYPNGQAVYTLRDESGREYGEWRCGENAGAQSIIWGQHPSGCRYEILNAQCPKTIDFASINWIAPLAEAESENEEQKSDEQLFEELLAKYEAAICTSKELETLPIKPRKLLFGSWMREGDTGFVYGERGSGKTWLIDGIATHLSTGKELFDWTIPEAVDVLLVDGEMPGDETRDRLKGLSPQNERLHVLHHELLFDRTGLAINLTDVRLQRVITEICIRKNIKLLILDNLSCLFSELKENDADEWEKALNWLLELRRRRIAVLIVHYAGRSGLMRGTTRREDSAFWVIRIEEVKGRSTEEKGARFQISFTKQRNSDSPEWSREATFRTEPNGEISIGFEGFSFDGKVLKLIQDGLSTATEIAEELGVAKSTVSKAAKRLLDGKLIEKKGRNYEARGAMRK